MRTTTRALALALLALTVPAPAVAAGPPPPPLPLAHRSSIAAVLAQASALQLTPDQVKLLEQADKQLLREQEAARAAAAAPPEEGNPASATGGKPPSGAQGQAAAGGAKSRPPPNRKGGPDPAEALNQQLDGLDAEAFLKAIEGLPEPQREKAIEVGSRFREQLFEQREKERRRQR
jgi:hypothetical protein